jgi:FlaG/FlaF family flagellin (archaellin)
MAQGSKKISSKKNKKGLSIVIGYVLLIAVSVVMSIIVYQWLKTYVPKDVIKCDEGTSVFIRDVHYDCVNSILNITIKNNGRFSVDGYFIHVSNKTNEELAVIDISSKIISGGNISGNAIRFSDWTENSLAPEDNNVRSSSFNVAGYGTLTKVEIIPTRIQKVDGKNKFVSCGDSKVEETLTCA